MKLSESAEKLLIDVPKPSNWVPDEYDVGEGYYGRLA